MLNAITARAATDGSGSATTSTTITSGTDALANEQTFLKLFVAQLKNQDPLNPQDGTQFVAQLAQFSNLEQSLQMREDLDSIKQALQGLSSPTTDPTSTPVSQ